MGSDHAMAKEQRGSDGNSTAIGPWKILATAVACCSWSPSSTSSHDSSLAVFCQWGAHFFVLIDFVRQSAMLRAVPAISVV